MDLTSKLPVEVLCLVFSNITAMPDRFRVAAVSQRFRKCMFKQMKTQPEPLQMDFDEDRSSLSGHPLPLSKWLRALQWLTKEAKFSSIIFRRLYSSDLDDFFRDILHQFLTNNQCLSQVTEIVAKMRSSLLRRDSAAGLGTLISQCPKLSILKLSSFFQPVFQTVPTRRDPEDHNCPAMGLVPSLRDKPITELDLHLDCNQQHAIDILRAPKPNTLRKLKMDFLFPMDFGVDLVLLVKELCLIAPQSLQEIQFNGYRPNFLPTTELIACIPGLPSLRYMSIVGKGLDDLQLLVSAMKLLLSYHGRETPFVLDYHDYELDQTPCCQILACIRQIKQELPGLLFGYDNKIKKIKLRLESVTVRLQSFNKACDNPDCHECHSSYPVVIDSLALEAWKNIDCPLENHWLGRCKINNVVKDLKSCCRIPAWQAIGAELNGTHTNATVKFKQPFGEKEFSITVDIGNCFDTSCAKCIEE